MNVSTLPAALCLFVTVFSAYAQTFGGGQLRIVSPYPPGGGTDTLGRIIAQRYTERSGYPAIVENRAGANGTIGAAYVAKSQGDGLTLLIVPAGYAANPSLYKSLPYDQSRDLAPVSLLASGPLVLVTALSLPVRTPLDLIALARARPGELNYGSPGSGGLPHLSAELFASMAGIKLTHVPYKAGSLASNALLGNEVQMNLLNMLNALPHMQSGRLRGLGVTGFKRSQFVPALPTLDESGAKGYEMLEFHGLAFPAGTPRAIVMRMNRDLATALKSDDLKKRLSQQAFEPSITTPEEFGAYLLAEQAKYAKIVKTIGLKPD